MTARLSIECSSHRMYNGRRSLYLSLVVGRRWVFLSRWDTARVTLKPRQVDLHRGPVMTWYAGIHTPEVSR